MEIEIKSRSATKRAFLSAIVPFIAKELNLAESKYTLIVHTEGKLRNSMGCEGVIFKTGEKELTMFVDTALTLSSMLLTVAHEMVHVKQYAKGQLKSIMNSRGQSKLFWFGKSWSHVGYDDYPWEKEAFRRQSELALSVMKCVK